MLGRSAAASVVALLVLAACGETSQVQVQPEARSAPSVPAPQPPAGTRLIGLGRAVVAVPQAWGMQETHCGQPTQDTVYFAEGSARSCLVNQTGIASLAIARVDSSTLGKVTRTAAASRKVNGVIVLSSAVVCETSQSRGCAVSLVVPSEKAMFTLRVPRGQVARGAPLAEFRESLRILPVGYTTVPFVEYGVSVDHAQQLLAASGLRSESPDVDFPHYATGTEPPAGTVVAFDDVVMLTIGDG